jgi:hypothetical protein
LSELCARGFLTVVRGISAALSEDWPRRTIVSLRVAPERVESVCPVRWSRTGRRNRA